MQAAQYIISSGDGYNMPKSMTGYGKSVVKTDSSEISFELKSVNNRFLDTSLHLPRTYSFAEDKIKKLISSKIARGKIDAYLNITRTESSDTLVTLDESLLRQYVAALKKIAALEGVKDDISVSTIARYSDIFTQTAAPENEENLFLLIEPAVSDAIDSFVGMRVFEGQRLYKDILSKLSELEEDVLTIEKLYPESVKSYYDRLFAKLSELLESRQIDQSRIVTEAAVFADRVSADEEITRLKSHIAQFISILKTENEPVGKKLDFLVQEMNREINTIGSKCNMLEITRLVIDVKSIIEKIREQIQNIE
ncbi:MAG: YicC/YloC family endoribonuclease [Oscillospiraceae bacterium]|nr:YicC/YloC family endoribonuclease [Oscillospiraceae bacterium]